jgi:hypothetical protein
MSYDPQDFGGYSHPKYQTLVALALAGMFAGIYMIAAFSVIGHCYYNPCYEGGGIVFVWKVNASISWPSMLTGFMLSIASWGGWHHLRTKNVSTDSIGILTGLSIASLVAALGNCFVWGCQNLLMTELIRDHPTQQESGRNMVVNSNLQVEFTSLTVYSSILFILYLVICFHLITRRNEMLGTPGGLGAAYGSEYTPFGDGPDASNIPRKEGMNTDNTGYNDL